MNKWTQGVFCECYDVRNMAHHGVLSPASLPASISASQIHHSLLILLTFYLIFKVRSECLVTFILSIRFSILSADSWHFSKVTSFVCISHLDISIHLFTSVTTGPSHIVALPKPISGVPPNQDQASMKWAKLWETNDEMKQRSWKKWWNKNSKETGTVPTINSSLPNFTHSVPVLQSSNFTRIATLPCHCTICAMTYVHPFAYLTPKKDAWFSLVPKMDSKQAFFRFARSKSMAKLRSFFHWPKCGIFERSIAFSSLVEFTWPHISVSSDNLSENPSFKFLHKIQRFVSLQNQGAPHADCFSNHEVFLHTVHGM